MKKLVMTFAIVAFLIGGLTINANAQDKNKGKAGQENVQKGGDSKVVVNYDQLIKEYETNVNNYIAAYDKAQKNGTTEKAGYMTYQNRAMELQNQLDKAKLTKDQQAIYNKLKEKFAEALKRK